MAPDRNETINSAKPLTYRVENIPSGTSEQGLTACFAPQDQPYLQVKSLCPSVDTAEGEDDDLTATVFFQPPEASNAALRIVNDTITIDKEFYGFTPLYAPSKEKGPIAADIIAVTGLAGHAYGSWAHSPDRMWLRDYLPKDVPNARILTYGYPSELQASNAVTILQDHTNTFVHRLVDMRESGQCESRPIVLIGHSLGCLIIKKALIGLESMGISRRRIPVRALIFLAAPHRGLNVTALQTLVKGEPSERLIEELRAESATLTDLNRGFAYIAKDVEILTCYETKPTKTAINVEGTWKREGPPAMMVSPDSAQQFYFKEKCVSANTDHSQIAKLKKGQSGIYSNVKSAIRHALTSTAKIMASADASLEAKVSKEEYPSDKKTAIDGNAPDAPPPYRIKTEPVQIPPIDLQELSQTMKALGESSFGKQNNEGKNEATISAKLVSRPKEKTEGIEKPKENKTTPQNTSQRAKNSDKTKEPAPPPISKAPTINTGPRISKGIGLGFYYICSICEDNIPHDAPHYHCLACPDSGCIDSDVCLSCFDRIDLSSSNHDFVKARIDVSTGDRFAHFS